MSWAYNYSDCINLHVEGRISLSDAHRQDRTARDILSRLQTQPGIILADEVGMGKTFVSLAVAVSIALADRRKRPVVVMVPSSLREKWPRDFELFKERCLPEDLANRLKSDHAERGSDFLKLIDDPPERRCSIIFLTHGAMSSGLTDPWVKLALIQRALYHRRDTQSLRRALLRVMGKLLMTSWVDSKSPDLWEKLLATRPENWLDLMHGYGINQGHGGNSGNDDDPVPLQVIQALGAIRAESVFEALKTIPYRRGTHFDERLTNARRALNQELRSLWRTCLKKTHFNLPLLILDEAHHLKNARTRLASLFQVPEAEGDAEEIKGALGGVFERMLFMTATPFQLGHHELCSVLQRFEGIAWDVRTAPTSGQSAFRETISRLRARLDAAQEAAVSLDIAWGHLRKEDISFGENKVDDVAMWWEGVSKGMPCTTQGTRVLDCFNRVETKMREAEETLAPWVIRHIKPKVLPEPHSGKRRRRILIGEAIFPGSAAKGTSGIPVSGDHVLPFLLAARAVACSPESRPVFAEGLASSYEAFMLTRRAGKPTDSATDFDDEETSITAADEIAKWYLQRLYSFLTIEKAKSLALHPKIDGTVKRVLDAWKRGEKVLVFCHYIATGRSLRQYISEAIRLNMVSLGAKKLMCGESKVLDELESLGRRFFDSDSPIRRACESATMEILEGYPDLREHERELVDIVRRYVRTPTFLVRYFPLNEGRLTEEAMYEALDTKDESGQTLKQVLKEFFAFLNKKCGKAERENYIQAAGSLQTGTYLGAEVGKTFNDDELQGERTERLVPNVRLVNGAVRPETRQKLMLTFNTPFYPEVLIASSVMAEGVDLHLCCRQVIHHDLCWNPSTLEQRTGRVDRIGAKIERCGLPLNVYLPFIAETQDEKMYRVVMDRERWFKVLMGENYRTDLRTTERMADRIPFPETAAQSLAFRLDARDGGSV